MQRDVGVLDLRQLRDRVRHLDGRFRLVLHCKRMIEILSFSVIDGITLRRQDGRRHGVVGRDAGREKPCLDVAESVTRAGEPVVGDAGVSSTRNDVRSLIVTLERLLRSRVDLSSHRKMNLNS